MKRITNKNIKSKKMWEILSSVAFLAFVLTCASGVMLIINYHILKFEDEGRMVILWVFIGVGCGSLLLISLFFSVVFIVIRKAERGELTDDKDKKINKLLMDVDTQLISTISDKEKLNVGIYFTSRGLFMINKFIPKIVRSVTGLKRIVKYVLFIVSIYFSLITFLNIDIKILWWITISCIFIITLLVFIKKCKKIDESYFYLTLFNNSLLMLVTFLSIFVRTNLLASTIFILIFIGLLALVFPFFYRKKAKMLFLRYILTKGVLTVPHLQIDNHKKDEIIQTLQKLQKNGNIPKQIKSDKK